MKKRDRRLEWAEPKTLRECQQLLLRQHLLYACQHAPFYRQRCDSVGIDPATCTLEDLWRLPRTSKSDLEQSLPQMQAIADTEVADICLTSGTTGNPVALPQSRHDLQRLAYNEEMGFRTAGLGPDDRVLIAAAMDRCFMAGLAYYQGLQQLKATAIRGGSSSLTNLADMVRRLRPTAVIGVPSLLLALARRLQEEGVDPAATAVTRLLCIGEPVRQPDLTPSRLGALLAELWNAQVFGTYASTEMATAFTECAQGQGGHLRPELMVVEILDDQGQPVPDGALGEVVVTPLDVTGLPLVRYRTGDLARLLTAPCGCGRNTPRLGPVEGRLSQRLKIRGTTVYPPAIALALQALPGVQGHYIEVRNTYALADEVRVVVGAADPALTAETVAETIAGITRVRPEVVLRSPQHVRQHTLQENFRKPMTFFDYRGQFLAPAVAVTGSEEPHE